MTQIQLSDGSIVEIDEEQPQNETSLLFGMGRKTQGRGSDIANLFGF